MTNDCKSWYEIGNTTSGVYTINPDGGTPFEVVIILILYLTLFLSLQVYCDMETNGGGWIVFQRRQDGSVNFYRNWTDYENGFGNLTGEFWLGLSKIHRLTKEGSNTLRVDLGDFENNTAYAQYSTFSISNSTTEYTLTVGGYSGNAGDSLDWHNGRTFSTAACFISQGGWWFYGCFHSHLNGPYSHTPSVSSAYMGIIWRHWKGPHYSLKFTEMKLHSNN